MYVRRVLVGREPERALLGALVERARHGSAGSLVVRGEPGVGKSALLDELVDQAGRATVLRTQGLEVEAPLAFAALHRLLRPLARLRDQLPGPQARALGVAFGEDDGPSIEPFLIGVATLSLLTAAAEESLVLCVVDDAHWLDPATAGALLFCARRLGADRAVMVFAAREGDWATFDPQGLSELGLTGLDADASRALLEQKLESGRPRTLPSGSSWRHAATPWRCWSCPVSSLRPSSRGHPRCRRSCTSAPTSSRSSSTGVGACRLRCNPCCCWPPPTTPAT